ncbi:MAG: helix-turn-helix domain-containing protein [Candidatus Woesearchaeota archaeon]
MIVKDEFLSKLRRYFNLNLYEVKIWTALLSRGVSTAGELSDIANVPRSRSYDVLESLEKKGFITQKVGKPIKYIALPPQEVVERVKKNVKKEAEESVKRLENLKNTDVLNELSTLHTQGVELVEPSDLTGSLRGRHNLYNHIEMTLKEAEKEVIIMTTEEGAIRKIDSMLPIFEELYKRGVKIKFATELTKQNEKQIKDISKYAEVRETKTKARFVIVDGEELIFMVTNDKEVHPSYDIGLWINTPFFANALSELFNLAWNQMKPLEKALKN